MMNVGMLECWNVVKLEGCKIGRLIDPRLLPTATANCRLVSSLTLNPCLRQAGLSKGEELYVLRGWLIAGHPAGS